MGTITDDQAMTVLDVDGDQVAYTDSGGTGTPLLLLHAGVFGSWFAPLATEPALDGHRVIRVLRAGYTAGPAPSRPLSMADHAAHAAAVLDALGVCDAHVAGHSSSTEIVLQLALDRPDLVAALILSEPPLVDSLADPADLDVLHATLGPVIGAAMGAFAAGDIASAYDAFMGGVCGPEHRSVLAAALGADAVTRAEQDSRFFFADEVRAANMWTFDAATAARVTQPVLLVQGGESPAPTHRLVAHLAGMLPDARIATIEGDNHLLPLRSPAALAELVAGFAG
ncbi:alpha/beta fold hydrolase [Pseudonocardia sp. GCM10023141]|uniref:alpha/beta fold hydrolase n=1 Tax=Pseudonocardia sp. GCM10023141 TaxID=3252653 RepID=UPI003612E821